MDNVELQVLRDLPIEGVAERLGLRVQHHKALCPFHNDHHASLSFNLRRNSYRCFVCDSHGDTINLVMNYLHVDFREACRWLAAGTHIIVDAAPRPAAPPPPSPFDASRYEGFFRSPWLSAAAQQFLFGERRLDPRVVSWCRLASWVDKSAVEWLQIPYYDVHGRLIGIQNRRLGAVPAGMPRFRFPRGSQCGIYNLPVLQRLRSGDELWITEGASDCWAMLSAGRKAVAIPSATLLSPANRELLCRLAAAQHSTAPGTAPITFHMSPDRDVPGEQLFLRLKEILPDLQHHPLPPDCKDYADYYVHHLSHPADG